MRVIYCPTDFSDLANHALDWAISLGQKLNAPVHVLHTYQVPYSADMMSSSLNEALKESSEKEMEALLKPYTEKGLHLTPELEWNSVTGALRHRTRANPEAIVVMGSHGSSGWNATLMGSNAVAVMHAIQNPLIIIPAKAAFYPDCMRWMYATDLQDESNPQTIAWLKQFMADSTSTMDLMHVESGDIDKSEAEQFLEYAHDQFEGYATYLVVNKSVEQGIYECASDQTADGIVMIGRRHHWLKEAFHQSVSKAVAQHQAFPVLILKEL